MEIEDALIYKGQNSKVEFQSCFTRFFHGKHKLMGADYMIFMEKRKIKLKQGEKIDYIKNLAPLNVAKYGIPRIYYGK